ncbi:nucleoside triphosphate pyrophosphohydrolase family protein [Aeromonas veronii]|uniref:hypothetical protein n=1 Tax=Aeromonas veronii TaxID=654 RepID=UPI0018F18445|nr:hypothetical protein [Aeromonas veronii]MBJ7591976.1 hypothetical protein [Aeromonas veronii]
MQDENKMSNGRMTVETINQLAVEIFEQNRAVGWWDDLDRCQFQTLQLVNTEIAEATEGDRKGLMDDHLPHRKMAEVELADTMIRALDIAGRYGWRFSIILQANHDMDTSLIKFIQMVTSSSTMAVKLLGLTGINCLMASRLWGHQVHSMGPRVLLKPVEYDYLIDMCRRVAEAYHFDLESAIREKLAYNAKRADHKRENRAQSGGKSY